MKRILILILIVNMFCSPIYALDFDTSVDDDIRRNYNPSKLEDDMSLPVLPKILQQELNTGTNETIENTQKFSPPQPTKVAKPAQAVQKQPVTIPKNNGNITPQPNYNNTIPKTINRANSSSDNNQVQKVPQSGNCAVIKQGTKFKVKLLTNLSDRGKKGARLTFASKYPVSTTYLTLPTGTIFKGKITNTHSPQITGNGGLITINIDTVIINGEPRSFNAFVTKANKRHIFFNNIKGKRCYMKSMANATKPGRHFFRKMCRVSGNLAKDGSSFLLSPFAIGLGAITLTGNVIVSPAVAAFHKGEHIYIPAGSDFEIKTNQDVMIYY